MKKYKAGTKITLHCCTHDFQSEETEVITLDSDTTEEELNDLAKEFFYSTKEPEYWFTEGDEEE